MTDTRSASGGLSLTGLKFIAVLAMTVDHIAYAFVPDGTVPAIVMHIIGRITGPVMFYAAVEGFHRTRDIDRYLLRLAVFAAVSWFPFLYFRYGGIPADMPLMRPNVIYTIFLGVLAVRIRRSERLRSPVLKILLISVLVILCVPADWGCTGILMILVLDFFYGDFRQQAFAYCLLVLCEMDVLTLVTSPFFHLFYEGRFSIDPDYFRYTIENVGAFLPMALLSRYRGRRGGRSVFSKWFFYLYYPLHLLVLGFLQTL